MSLDDEIRLEAEKIANAYLPATAPDRDAAQELAQPDNGDLLQWAKEYVKPHVRDFLDRVIRDGKRGGRNTEKSFDLMAWLALGYSGRGADVNVFLDRFGVPEDDARRKVQLVQRVEGLGERQAIELTARFLRGYLERVPSDKGWLLEQLGMTALGDTDVPATP